MLIFTKQPLWEVACCNHTMRTINDSLLQPPPPKKNQNKTKQKQKQTKKTKERKKERKKGNMFKATHVCSDIVMPMSFL